MRFREVFALVLTWLLLHASFLVFSQEMPVKKNRRHIIKYNVPSLAVNTYQVQTEYLVGKKLSLSLSARYMPRKAPPFSNLIASLIDGVSADQIQDVFLSNTAISPELRYYFGKKGSGSGWYVSPFFTIAHYRADFNFEIEFDELVSGQLSTRKVDIIGKAGSLTGGIYFGKQWKVGGRLYVDWWVVGGSYGRANGHVAINTLLTNEQQDFINENLTYEQGYPIVQFSPRVDSKGAYVDFISFWAGIKSGLCIGVSF